MITQTLIQKLNNEVMDLRKDIFEMKRVILAAISDPEGDYRESFVRKIFGCTKEKPQYRFTNKIEFFKQIHGRKK